MYRALRAALFLLFTAAPLAAQTPVSATEGNSGTKVFTITISQGPNNPQTTYQWSTVDGTATAADNDYIPTSGEVILGGVGNPLSKDIEVAYVGDTKFEADETFTFVINNVEQYIFTIQNDDIPTLQVVNVSVKEGNSGTTSLDFPVTLTAAASAPVTATYQTIGGSATPGADYTATQGQITFQPGETKKTISVPIVGETLVEGDETIELQILLAGGAAYTVFGTILNDDTATFTVSSPSVREGNSGTTPMTFDITLVEPAGVQLAFGAITEGITATVFEDYEHVQKVFFLDPGLTKLSVVVNVIGDTKFESDETFALDVSLPGGAPVRAIGTILNDDIPPPSSLVIFSGNNQQGILGQKLANPLVVEVRDARGGPSAGVTVQWRVTRGSAQLTPTSSTTDANGRASTSVVLDSVGTIEIEASVTGLTPVKFTVTSGTNLEARAEGPVAIPVAHVLDQICARNEEQFNAVCRALAGLPEVTPALERIAPQTSGAQSKISSEFVSSITSDIRNRLSALRAGSHGVSVAGFSLFHHGRAIPVAQLATAFLPQATDAGAPEDDYSAWSGFLSGNLGNGERPRRNGALGFDLESQGLMFGVDRLIGRSGIVGASVNWMKLDSDLDENAGKVDTTGYALSIYASRSGIGAGSAPGSAYDGMHLDGSITVGRNNYDSEHVVDIPGMPLSRATSDNDATVFAVSAVTGFEAHRGRGDFDLSLGGTWSRSDIDDMTEDGTGPLILFVQGHEIESLTGTLGVSARGAWPVPFGTLLPSFRAELVHEFDSDARLVTARFLRDTLGTSFTVPVDQPDANYGKLAAGLQAEFGYGISALIEVTQDVARDDLDFRTLQFTLRKQFR